jgi:glycosyltransferase involved in cell wall biosynthesis
MLHDPPLEMRHFPLQRGFARPVVSQIAREGSRIAKRLGRQCRQAPTFPLICTTPAYASVAEHWRGQLIYYVTDAFISWGLSNDPYYIIGLDRRMCHRADLVCPDSQRIADYLISEAGCHEAKLLISPMATRAANLLPAPLVEPMTAPADIAHLSRPIAGVIGNLAANMDWELLYEAVERTPWLSWAFVGPTDMPVSDSKQRRCRAQLRTREGRVRFTGYKAYGELRQYARAVDVAILPYRKCEPTFSGSSTRFYEHLAACRPIIATRGFEELLHKEPLLRLVDSAEQLTNELNQLRSRSFHDSLEHERWDVSRRETWETRVQVMLDRLRRLN